MGERARGRYAGRLPGAAALPARRLLVLLAALLGAAPLTHEASAALSANTRNLTNALTGADDFSYYGAVRDSSPTLYYRGEDAVSSSATSTMADSSGGARNGTYNARTDGAAPWWKFDEGSGSTAADASGTAAPGTLTGANAGWNATGRYGAGFAVTSGTGYVLGTPTARTDGDWTVMAWVYATADNATMAAAAQTGDRSSAFMLKRDGGVDRFMVVTTRTDVDNPTVDQVVGTTAASLNTWFHVAATYVDSTNTVTLYVNASSEGSVNTKSADWNATGNVVAGRSQWANVFADQWIGRIDEVRVYDRALNSTDIGNARSGGTTVSPITTRRTGALAGADQSGTYSVASTGAAGAYYGSSYANPNPFTIECLVKVTGSAGGTAMGFSGSTTGAADANHDRVLYVDSGGRVSFAVNNGAIKTVRSAGTVNDGAWHHLAASIGAAGQKLYVDGTLVASDAAVTTAANFTGYWRFGGMSLAGYSNQPTSDYLIGSLDEMAVYPAQLADEVVSAHQVARS
ncbi:hypothetical protein GCM10010124_28540 [Pilimelia terevasa]|uniref:LamG-like jellyroll fold domain-containing protein n=1 Tax=Pilimelia terevasa TaxID=53372 RepID=A0A8J3BTR5_9ACTN|nr:LamG domain-containing protein [Pilimelia terevasa]GGK34213.1 hypothetical protein GCM10010124_28540 [Pilimelia terevasa]